MKNIKHKIMSFNLLRKNNIKVWTDYIYYIGYNIICNLIFLVKQHLKISYVYWHTFKFVLNSKWRWIIY